MTRGIHGIARGCLRCLDGTALATLLVVRIVVLAVLVSLVGISDASAERRTLHRIRAVAPETTVDTVSSAGKRSTPIALDLTAHLARRVDRHPSVALAVEPSHNTFNVTSKVLWPEMLVRMRDHIYEPFPSTRTKHMKVRSFFLAVRSADGTCPGFGAIGKF